MTAQVLFRVGVLVAVLGVAGVAIGGSLIAFSQTRNSGGDILTDAFEARLDSDFMEAVARVNSVEISGEDLAFALALDRASREANPRAYEVTRPRPPTASEMLDSMIKLELLYQESKDRGLLCSDQEVREVAQNQIAGVRESDPSILEAWAAHLGIATDDLATSAEALQSYGRKCAQARLEAEVVPAELQGTAEGAQLWDEFGRSLVAAADIEILDPSLQ